MAKVPLFDGRTDELWAAAVAKATPPAPPLPPPTPKPPAAPPTGKGGGQAAAGPRFRLIEGPPVHSPADIVAFLDSLKGGRTHVPD